MNKYTNINCFRATFNTEHGTTQIRTKYEGIISGVNMNNYSERTEMRDLNPNFEADNRICQ